MWRRPDLNPGRRGRVLTTSLSWRRPGQCLTKYLSYCCKKQNEKQQKKKKKRHIAAWAHMHVSLAALQWGFVHELTTSEHSHAYEGIRPQEQSPQCGCCFVPVLVCVEQGDTAVRVSSQRVQGVEVIGTDQGEISSLHLCTVYPQPQPPPPPSLNPHILVRLHSHKFFRSPNTC